LPWILPPPPLLSCTRALCCLPADSRRPVFDLHTQLEMKAEEYMLLRDTTSASERALDIEAEMFRTFLVREELQTCVIRALSRGSLPTTAATLQQSDAFFSANFAVSERLEGDTSSASMADDPGMAPGGAMTVQSTAEDRARNAIRMEMRTECEYLSRLISAMNKWLLTSLIIATEREADAVSALESEQQQSSRVVTTNKGPGALHKGPQAPSVRGALSRTDIVLTFVNRLRARGTRVRTHGASELHRSYVFTERDISECTEDLGKRLLKWGNSAVVAQQYQAAEGMTRSSNSLEYSELVVMQNMQDRHFRLEELDAQVDSTVADRNQKLFFEIDRLHRVLEEMMSSSREMEHRLHSDICRSVKEEITVLEKDVEDVKTRYDEFRKEMQVGVESELKAQRQSLIQKLSSLATSNFALQQKLQKLQTDGELAPDVGAPMNEDDHASKQGSRRPSKAKIDAQAAQAAVQMEIDEFEEGDEPRKSSKIKKARKTAWWATDETQLGQEETERPILVPSGVAPQQVEPVSGLQNEVAELKHVQVRSRTLFTLKFQAMRQQFEQLIQALALTLSSNAELWERVAEVREREQLIQAELGKSHRQMTSCEETIQVLRTQMETNDEWRQQLQTWKDSVREHLGELENRVDRQSKIGSVNIERLLLEHERRDATLEQFEKKHKNWTAAQQEKEFKERQKIHAKLQQEKNLVMQAEAKASLMRGELERGGSDRDSLVTLWQQQHQEFHTRLAELEVQNYEIRSRLGIGADGRFANALPSDTQFESSQRRQPTTQPSASRGAEEVTVDDLSARSLPARGTAPSRSPGPEEPSRSASARGDRLASPREALEESAAFSIGLTVHAPIPGTNRRTLENPTLPLHAGARSVAQGPGSVQRPPVMRAFQTPSPGPHQEMGTGSATLPTAGLHHNLVPKLLPRAARKSTSRSGSGSASARNTPVAELEASGSTPAAAAARSSSVQEHAQPEFGRSQSSPTRGTRNMRRSHTGVPSRFPGVA